MPSLKGRRLTVYNIVSGCFFDGIESYQNDFELNTNQIKDAITYCKGQKCKEVEQINFCDGCILRGINEKKFDRRDYLQTDVNGTAITTSMDGKIVFFGTINELYDEHLGKLGWVIADELHAKMF